MSTGVSHVNELHLVFHDSHVRKYEEENWLINIRQQEFLKRKQLIFNTT